MSRALHLLTTGATYLASDPLLSNLFSKILPTPKETIASALEIAEEIVASTSTVSTKVMYRGPGSAEEAHLLESKLFLGMLMSKDSAEGMKSFMEKRDVDFKGNMKHDAPVGWPWWEFDGALEPKL